jgi:hypothetical protein
MSNEHERWALLRVWHCEAMESVIDRDDPIHFTRTSYLSAPARWSGLPTKELARRVEIVLNASYKRRAWELRTAEDTNSLVPFAFYFEWVDRDDVGADPLASVAPFLYPCTVANPRLAEIAFRDLDALAQAARPGLASRCYAGAFSAFRIDVDDTWHLVRHDDRAALFAARHA